MRTQAIRRKVSQYHLQALPDDARESLAEVTDLDSKRQGPVNVYEYATPLRRSRDKVYNNVIITSMSPGKNLFYAYRGSHWVGLATTSGYNKDANAKIFDSVHREHKLQKDSEW